jgi:hypothetical protein
MGDHQIITMSSQLAAGWLVASSTSDYKHVGNGRESGRRGEHLARESSDQ